MDTIEKMLRDVLGERVADELLEEMNLLFEQAKTLGYKEMRPWTEFFGGFKPPQMNVRHIEQRVTTNFLHYRSNYFMICLGLLLLQIIFAPMIIFSTALVAAFCTYMLFIHKKPFYIGEIVIDDRAKMTICGVFSVLLLVLTGTLEHLIWCVLYITVLCGGHMLFRPRSVSSKSNKVYEELKLNGFNLFSPSAASAAASAVATSAAEDPENPSKATDAVGGKDEGYSSNLGSSTAVRKRGAAGVGAATAGGSSITGLYANSGAASAVANQKKD